MAGHYKSETLETLKDWILDEAEYGVKVVEAIKGLKLNSSGGYQFWKKV